MTEQLSNGVKWIVGNVRAKGHTAKSMNTLFNEGDKSRKESACNALRDVVEESGFAASGGIAHTLAMVEFLVRNAIIDGENDGEVKRTFKVLLALENSSAAAQAAGLRVDSDNDKNVTEMAKEWA